jgi:hypothetical protein
LHFEGDVCEDLNGDHYKSKTFATFATTFATTTTNTGRLTSY